MAKLTTKQRDRMRATGFAYPERKLLPIQDAGHVRSALGRFSRTQFEGTAAMKRAAKRILSAAKKHGISVDPDSHVARAVGAGISGQRGAAKRRNPSSGSSAELAKARRLAQEFHGSAAGQVVEIPERERMSPGRFAVVVGELDDLTYQPRPGSNRAAARYRHESGDRGPFRSRSPHKPLLVVSPDGSEPRILMGRSGMKLTKDGLIG